MNKLFSLILILIATFSFSQAKIEWVSIEQAEQIQEENPDKPMFIDVYTDWCGWCKKMDKSTFLNPEVVAHISENYIPVKLDAEQKSIINFKGKKYQYVSAGRAGVNTLAYYLLDKQLSYPSYVVLSSEGEKLNLIRGYVESNDLLNQL